MPYNSPGDKAGPLRYTRNYVYNIADCLGKGATASVFLGRDRSKGNQVAIKVFTKKDSHLITQARLRETELLKRVNHRNVMRLLACETETVSGNQVIVLPYCQGGSVYTLLEQPQNGFGFQETEFLRFLKDISSGLEYLRQKGILHRDIKPGNIMKGVEEDGSSVYILTDFGAARELDEEETFMSIYGTEEYIHPDMFQRAVLRQPGQTQFTSSVDLWSLGVTIYHVATGKLPFQAYGGRNDSHMMFQITTGRSSGEISGIQSEPEGPIERSRQLPENCYLSRGLRKKIEPILAGLFEIDSRRVFTFGQFFDAVNDVIAMKTLSVFLPRQARRMTLYLHKTDSYTHIQEKIASVTEIPADRQLLLLGHTELKEIVELNEQVQTYPKSVQNAQFFLFERDHYEFNRPLLSDLPPFPSFAFSSSLSNDSSVAKQCAAVAYFIKRKTEDVLLCQNLLLEAKLHLRLYVQAVLSPIERIIPELDREVSNTDKRTASIRVSQENLENFMKLVDVFKSETAYHKDTRSLMKSFCNEEDQMSEIMSKTKIRCEEIKVYTSVLGQRLREASTSSPTDHLGCNDQDHCLCRVDHIGQGIQNISNTFSKHKKYGELHEHEKFIHKVERQKLEDLCVTILSLFQGHCVRNLQIVHEAVNKQLSILLKHLTRTAKVETNIDCVMECQRRINEKLQSMDTQYREVSDSLRANIKEIIKKPGSFSKGACRKEGDSSGRIGVTSEKHEEKSFLMKRLLAEMNQLETERSELNALLSSNTQSLLELKRMLQQTARLSPTSFQHDKKSVECTEDSLSGVEQLNSNAGLAASDFGLGASNTGLGVSNTGLGASNTGLGVSNTGLGASNTGLGASNTGFGVSNTGLGASNTGLGASNTGLGASNAGLGASNTGLGASNTGLGTSNAGLGASNAGLGASNADLVTSDSKYFGPKGEHGSTKSESALLNSEHALQNGEHLFRNGEYTVTNGEHALSKSNSAHELC